MKGVIYIKSKWMKIMAISVIWFIFFVIMGIIFKGWWQNRYGHVKFRIESLNDIRDVLTLSAVGSLIVIVKTAPHKKPDLLSWMEKYRYEPSKESLRKKNAQRAPVDEVYLSKEVNGLVLGRQGDRFVRYPLEKGRLAGGLLVGIPGSGKSCVLLCSIIGVLNYQETHQDQDKITIFAMDIKPELRQKSSFYGDENVNELSISDRSQWGWNPYYGLKADASDDEVLMVLDTLTRALIDSNGNSKAEFFYESARSILKFYALYLYRTQSMSFYQAVDNLMGANLEETIQKTLEDAEGKANLVKVKKGLQMYGSGEGAGETMQSISLTLRQSLSAFARSDVRWFLNDNPRKLSPIELERVSIFFTVRSTDLNEYKAILKMVIFQILRYVEERPERESHLLLIFLDELYRIIGGDANGSNLGTAIIDSLSLARSHNTVIISALQGIQQLEAVFSKSGSRIFMEMLSFIEILAVNSVDTAEEFSKLAGEYEEERISTNYGTKNAGSYSQSWEHRRIAQPSDFMRLKKDNKVALFIDGEFHMVSPAQYYKIPKLLETSKRCLESYKKDH